VTATNACCLCGSSYERLGNNPYPLSSTGRCCDACDEVVIEARIDPASIGKTIERVTNAMLRIGPDQLHQAAIAAICASRGPELWSEKQRLMAQLQRELSGGRDDDGE
jgi:hypothetical protein